MKSSVKRVYEINDKYHCRKSNLLDHYFNSTLIKTQAIQ